MTRPISILFTVVALTTATSCKKERQPAENPEVSQGVQVDSNSAAAQDPPPAELATARTQYLLGNYGEAASTTQPLYDALEGPSQKLAKATAGSWLALATAKDVVENAEAPARRAMEIAQELGDPALLAVAKLAYGAYLLGTEDFDAAIASFEAASSAQSGPSPEVALAHLLRAEALLGRAYGGGESTSLQNPADLQAAKASYEQAAAVGGKTEFATILQGRAEEGLAAVAKYQGNTAAICQHASKAVELYQSASASSYLREGPTMLATDARCPKK